MSGRPVNLDAMYTVKIDNLSYQTVEADLRDAFDRYGEIGDVYIPKDFQGGGSKGFGFVRYIHKRHAEKAIAKGDGKTLDGRELNVSEAPAPKTARWGGGGNFGPGPWGPWGGGPPAWGGGGWGGGGGWSSRRRYAFCSPPPLPLVSRLAGVTSRGSREDAAGTGSRTALRAEQQAERRTD